MIKQGEIKIKVEQVSVSGRGAIILTGPSSCGKGEVANGLRRFLDLPKTKHLSMGDMLRSTIYKARNDANFRNRLSTIYQIQDQISIFDEAYNDANLISKTDRYLSVLKDQYGSFVSQLDWLEFCVQNGLLIPDQWTINIINAAFESEATLKDEIFIIDGYPRTVQAAEALLKTFENLDIPIIKVVHLSITKDEMIKRAMGRNRQDDQKESLERRYQFYVENVQPSIDYLKATLGSSYVSLIDAHQPIYIDSQFDLSASIDKVTLDVVNALGLPKYLISL
ncbi:MAG: nucleoside monophosphate kinase [Clostridia bacterium]|nr:nucleoside monophosphate kinase [Clostridia bacterium]